MKPLQKNTNTYIWSGLIRCRVCGFSNIYFLRKWYAWKGVKKFSITPICRECFMDKKKIDEKKRRKSPERIAYIKKYIQENIEKIRAKNRRVMVKYRAKKKLEKLRDKNLFKTLR